MRHVQPWSHKIVTKQSTKREIIANSGKFVLKRLHLGTSADIFDDLVLIADCEERSWHYYLEAGI
jgi:hypothetical protein